MDGEGATEARWRVIDPVNRSEEEAREDDRWKGDEGTKSWE